MPVYQCVTSQTLSPELKAAIAKEITHIHVEFTAAPEPFVNVVFSDLPLGSHYLARAVREKRRPCGDVEDALETLRVVDRIYRRAGTNLASATS